MSYQEYNEIAVYALKRLGMFPSKYEILIKDAIDFSKLGNALNILSSDKSRIKNEILNFEENGRFDLPFEEIDSLLCRDSSKDIVVPNLSKDIQLFFEKLRNNDFVILVNRKMMDSYIRKETKLIVIVHEVIHYAQLKGKVPEGKTEEELDGFAKTIAKEFMERKGEEFIGDMLFLNDEE